MSAEKKNLGAQIGGWMVRHPGTTVAVPSLGMLVHGAFFEPVFETQAHLGATLFLFSALCVFLARAGRAAEHAAEAKKAPKKQKDNSGGVLVSV